MFTIDAESLALAIPVPPHIAACAAAVRYDLLHGPAYACVPAAGIEAFTVDHFATFAADLSECEGEVSEVYSGPVADALRAFIDAMPGTLYCDESGYVMGDSEPEGEWLEPDEEDGEPEWHEPEPYYAVSGSDLVAAVFGSTIGKEFR